MKKSLLATGLLFMSMALPALAANRFILRPSENVNVGAVCSRHGLVPVQPLDDKGNVYLVAASDIFTPDSVIADVSTDLDVTDIEQDRGLNVPETHASADLNQSTTAILDQISSRTVTTYFGQT